MAGLKELKSYTMTDGRAMVLSVDERGKYDVAQYNKEGEGRWDKQFDNAHDADVEYEKWRGHAAGT